MQRCAASWPRSWLISAPSPLLHGSPSTWASGVVRTVGWVDFLHDKTQSPHIRLGDIDVGFGFGFGISESSGAAKLASIRKLLRIHPFDHEWTLPSRMDDNSIIWMLQVNGLLMDIRNGLLMDIRQAPRPLEEIAFNKGFIPYIPADRRQGGWTMAKKIPPTRIQAMDKEWVRVSAALFAVDSGSDEQRARLESAFKWFALQGFRFGLVVFPATPLPPFSSA